MKVLYIHNDYGARSGEEVAAEGLARLLTSHGHEVFWCRRSSAKIGNSLAWKTRAFFAGIWNPFAAQALSDTLDEIKPDLVQVQNIYPFFSPSIFKSIRRRGIPIVMRCPNYRLFCPNGLHLAGGEVCEKCVGFGREAWCILTNCQRGLFKSTGYAIRNAWARVSGSILQNVDMFIVQTAFQKNKFVERGISESRIGVVPGLISDAGNDESQDLGDLVTFVGRVSPEKGIDEFLASARLLPDIPFAVAGDTSAMPNIRTGSPANVQWHGFLPPTQLLELYHRSRIIVVPSRWYEGFPNVMVQAMAMGKPVVCSAIGALPEIVDHGRIGLLFDPNNGNELAEKILSLFTNDELCRRLGAAARAKVCTEYSPETCYNRLMSVFAAAQHRSQPMSHFAVPAG